MFFKNKVHKAVMSKINQKITDAQAEHDRKVQDLDVQKDERIQQIEIETENAKGEVLNSVVDSVFK